MFVLCIETKEKSLGARSVQLHRLSFLKRVLCFPVVCTLCWYLRLLLTLQPLWLTLILILIQTRSRSDQPSRKWACYLAPISFTCRIIFGHTCRISIVRRYVRLQLPRGAERSRLPGSLPGFQHTLEREHDAPLRLLLPLWFSFPPL